MVVVKSIIPLALSILITDTENWFNAMGSALILSALVVFVVVPLSLMRDMVRFWLVFCMMPNIWFSIEKEELMADGRRNFVCQKHNPTNFFIGFARREGDTSRYSHILPSDVFECLYNLVLSSVDHNNHPFKVYVVITMLYSVSASLKYRT